MPFVSPDYATNPSAPAGKWICAPTSSLGPYDAAPNPPECDGPINYCGQCVSYVKVVCPSLPATSQWRRGDQVKTGTDIAAGTVIATFDANQHYLGHAAIYVSHDDTGIQVWDQYRTGRAPKPIGARVIAWGPQSYASNDGDKYYIVERM